MKQKHNVVCQCRRPCGSKYFQRAGSTRKVKNRLARRRRYEGRKYVREGRWE